MNRLLLLVLLGMPTTLWAAGSYYYTKPDATTLPDNGRILLYDPASGGSDKNLTGATLKSQIGNALTPSQVLTPLAVPGIAPLIKQTSSTNPYARVYEQKDVTGKIVLFTTASGTLILGTPVPLAVSAIYPANGATNVPISLLPQLTLNKNSVAQLGDSNYTLVGVSTTTMCQNSDFWSEWTIGNKHILAAPGCVPLTLAANTTYTLQFQRLNIVQTDGETTSSCGSAMTDSAGICTSTFTTAP